MRLCANPRCRVQITACFGTVKAGDTLEAAKGERKWTEVRELCPRCSTWMVGFCPTTPCTVQHLLFTAFGFGNQQKLLPAPAQ